jgi:hypothetical protein
MLVACLRPSKTANVHSNTVRLAQTAERVGAAHITVHGRTPQQRSRDPVSTDGIRLVCFSFLLLDYFPSAVCVSQLFS